MLNSIYVWGCEVNILKEAESIIYGDREQTYGKPGVNLERIADQWALYLQQKFGVEVSLTAEDVCWMMVDLKKCRQMNADKRDNLVDAAGYLALIERCADDAEQEALGAAEPSRAGPPRFAVKSPTNPCGVFWPASPSDNWCSRCGFPRAAHESKYKPFPAPLHTKE